MTESVSLALMIVALALVAVWMSYPDMRQKPQMIYLPVLPFMVYLACTVYRALAVDTVPPLEPESGLDCVMCVTLYSLVPGFWMFRTLRRHATTQPMRAGFVSLLAAASIGLLALKFLEPNDSVVHLVKFHIIPVILIGMIGAFIGKKFLSW